MATGQILSLAKHSAFVEANPGLGVEQSPEPEMVVMPPVHLRTDRRSSALFGPPREWPMGLERLGELTEPAWSGRSQIAPDFGLDLRSNRVGLPPVWRRKS